MLLFFIVVVGSGLMMIYGIGGRGSHGYWKNIHLFGALIFSLSAIFHFLSHGYWFKNLLKKQ